MTDNRGGRRAGDGSPAIGGSPAVDDALDRALDLDPRRRREFLRTLCGEDPELGRQVIRILEASDASDRLLETPVGSLVPDLVDRALDPAENGAGASGGDSAPLASGSVLGSYRLLREVGRGGMGVVYLAERADGEFERRVAIKVVKRGLDTDEILARFRRERQILAQLRHPNIGRLLDGGVTPDGRPYFVMEYVEGLPITRHCERGELSLHARLDLFEVACEAVRYAHRHLVVHRDLKPSNILVDAEGNVSLVDFGVARLLDPEHSGDPLTGQGPGPMTPEYASPEQASGGPPTTATDVFSLGVVLHELVLGRRPDEARDIAAAGPAPDRDLATVLHTAIEPDPGRRYDSVDALLADLRRYRAGLPIAARAAGTVYRTRRFVGRHPLGVTASGVAGLAALGFAGFHSARIAAERDRALIEARKAEQVTAFVVDLFRQADPDVPRPDTLRVEDFLAAGEARASAELADQPEARAAVMAAIGGVDMNLGRYDDAVRALEMSADDLLDAGGESAEAAAALRALARAHFERNELGAADSILTRAEEMLSAVDATVSVEMADVLETRATLRFAQDSLSQADSLASEALGLRRSVDPANDASIAASLTTLGTIARRRGDVEQAEAYFAEALDRRRRAYGEVHAEVASAWKDLALAAHQRGALDEAEVRYRRALDIQERLYSGAHPELARTLNSLGALLSRLGRFEEAEAVHRRALEMRREIYGNRHPAVATSLVNLSSPLQDLGRLDEATELLRDALSIRRETLGPKHPNTATVLNGLAWTLRERGELDEAARLFEEAEAIYVDRLGADHPWVGVAAANRGRVELLAGRPAAAGALFARAVSILRGAYGDPHDQTARALVGLGRALLAQGQAAESEPLLREGLEMNRAVLPDDHLEVARARSALGECLLALGRPDEAEPLLREALGALEKQPGTDARRERERAGRLLARLGP